MSTAGAPEGYALAYERGLAGVDLQSETMKDARERAGTLASVAAGIATIASGLAFRNLNSVSIRWWGIVGLVAGGLGFILTVASTVMVWRPAVITVRLDPRVIVKGYVEAVPPMDIAETHRWLALYLGDNAAANVPVVDGVLRWFSVGLVGLALETIGLVEMLLGVINK